MRWCLCVQEEWLFVLEQSRSNAKAVLMRLVERCVVASVGAADGLDIDALAGLTKQPGEGQ